MSADWVRSSVFHQIFPDRFFRSGRLETGCAFEPWDSPQTPLGFKGGSLQGIVDKLEHLSDLGVNALYLNPIFKSCANHRYHTFDYFEVDPLLGGKAALRELLDAAHARGIRVILDGVFNHCSRGFFQFNHLLENGEASPYKDWFHVRGFPLNFTFFYPGAPNVYYGGVRRSPQSLGPREPGKDPGPPRASARARCALAQNGFFCLDCRKK
ncbi:MAG: hypothetical protein HY922_10980 [Elusimicrobia bacterium]|nr:hypothetical protein [Elusimicrobiota bacterium]